MSGIPHSVQARHLGTGHHRKHPRAELERRLLSQHTQMATFRAEEGVGVSETASEVGNVTAMLALSEQVRCDIRYTAVLLCRLCAVHHRLLLRVTGRACCGPLAF